MYYVPVAPDLSKDQGSVTGDYFTFLFLQVLVQPSTRRAYSINEYLAAGAEITDDLSKADAIVGRTNTIAHYTCTRHLHTIYTPSLHPHTPMNAYEYWYQWHAYFVLCNYNVQEL